ncbi:hypothetical protein [Kineococcus aurantiacus]|uniref:hypothetical protein n=1 Tax=Kineococcus aurantiacus TaxID=37633 RepID=UPI0031DDC507
MNFFEALMYTTRVRMGLAWVERDGDRQRLAEQARGDGATPEAASAPQGAAPRGEQAR